MLKISTRNTAKVDQFSGEKYSFNKKEDRITIPTFTKLLAINMVPSNSSGCFNKLFILSFSALFSSKLSKSEAFNEKKATSLPEIRAEQIKSNNKTQLSITNPAKLLLELRKIVVMKYEGSGSKIC